MIWFRRVRLSTRSHRLGRAIIGPLVNRHNRREWAAPRGGADTSGQPFAGASDGAASSRRAQWLGVFADYATAPFLLACSAFVGWQLFVRSTPPWAISGVAVAAAAIFAALIERLRPERLDYRRLDLPLVTDAAHFAFNYHLGYLLALGACEGVRRLLELGKVPVVWPEAWPLWSQVVFALLLAEGCSYWQHRLAHRTRWLWAFHALHHTGSRLNLLRAGRFHFVDIGGGAFLVFLPLVLLGAPEAILVWVAILSGTLGVLEHANMRMRAPAWLSFFVCTPAVHRHHHSIDEFESNSNFGTSFMVFDILFGTFQKPRADGPLSMGIADDPIPRQGFWAQVSSPFLGRIQRVRID